MRISSLNILGLISSVIVLSACGGSSSSDAGSGLQPEPIKTGVYQIDTISFEETCNSDDGVHTEKWGFDAVGGFVYIEVGDEQLMLDVLYQLTREDESPYTKQSDGSYLKIGGDYTTTISLINASRVESISEELGVVTVSDTETVSAICMESSVVNWSFISDTFDGFKSQLGDIATSINFSDALTASEEDQYLYKITVPENQSGKVIFNETSDVEDNFSAFDIYDESLNLITEAFVDKSDGEEQVYYSGQEILSAGTYFIEFYADFNGEQLSYNFTLEAQQELLLDKR